MTAGDRKFVIVGEAGYPPRSGRKPVDTRRLVDACDVEGCWNPATQAHGFADALTLTCDEHAEQVMLELLAYLQPRGVEPGTAK